MVTKVFRAGVAAVAAAAALHANAVAAPTALAIVSAPLAASAFGDHAGSIDVRRYAPISIQPLLAPLPPFPLEPAATEPRGAGASIASAIAPAPMVTLEPAGGGGSELVSPAPAGRSYALATKPSGAVVDISMSPVANPGAGYAASLQPAIYSRPIAPTAGSVVGPDDAPNIFGSVALVAGHTPEDAKWRRVADYVPTAGAGPWSSILARARRQSTSAQLEVVNAWVNHAISYAADVANYGVADHWGTARESLTRGRGDCKDYAIAKMELLRALGVPSDDLYLVLVKDLVRRQDHAVLAVRQGARFVILDSGFDGVMDSEEVRDYRPILTYSGARTWVHGFRRTPDVMVAAASPAAVTSYASQ